jgi:hypothetical protein
MRIEGLPTQSSQLRDTNPARKATDRNPEGGRIGFQTTLTLFVCGRCEAVQVGAKDWERIKKWGWLCPLCKTEV